MRKSDSDSVKGKTGYYLGRFTKVSSLKVFILGELQERQEHELRVVEVNAVRLHSPKRSQYHFLLEISALTSSSGWRLCHCAIGLRGLASMSDQWRCSVPALLLPSSTFPMASFFPILS